MSLIAPLVIVGATAVAGVSELKQHIPEWNARGYKAVEPYWGKVSLIAAIFSALFGTLTYLKTDNPVTSLIVSVIALFSIVIAYSDSVVRKVPAEISNYMMSVGAIIMFALTLAPNKEAANDALVASVFFPRVPTEILWQVILFGLLLLAVGFLGFLKVRSMAVAQIALSIAQIGLFLTAYAPLLWLAYSGVGNEYWSGVAKTFILPFTALGVVWVFAWAVGDKMGGADTNYMYFLSMTAPFILGPGGTLWAIVIAMPVQLIVHLIGSKLGMGYLKEVRNGPLYQFYENRKARKEGREPTTTKHRRAIAFLPVITIVVFIAVIGTGTLF